MTKDKTSGLLPTGVKGEFVGNMSLRMEPDGRCRKPALRRTGPDRYRPIGRQKCKYAEKSYKYKYDLGHSLYVCCCIIVVTSCTERERERESVRERSLPPPCNRRRVWAKKKKTRGCCLCVFCVIVFFSFYSVFYSSWAVVVFPTLWVFHVTSCV